MPKRAYFFRKRKDNSNRQTISLFVISTKGTNDCQCLLAAAVCKIIVIPFSFLRAFPFYFSHTVPAVVCLGIPGNWVH